VFVVNHLEEVVTTEREYSSTWSIWIKV